ncbi:MAG: SDR family NAD(P)-dependent oxidoreductase [Sphingobacterium sp.]|nr:SDR family NAD(P)-dependent oxidoreductase [Sphingobacterium sp.]
MDTGLAGKVALVCAASRGLGKAAARGLAAEGAKVAMCARHMPTLEAAAAEIQAETGAEVLAIGADVSRRVRHHEAGRSDGAAFRPPRHPRHQLGRAEAGPVRRDDGVGLARRHRPGADEHRAAVHGGRSAHAAAPAAAASSTSRRSRRSSRSPASCSRTPCGRPSRASRRRWRTSWPATASS